MLAALIAGKAKGELARATDPNPNPNPKPNPDPNPNPAPYPGELALGNYGLFRAHLALANQFLTDLPAADEVGEVDVPEVAPDAERESGAGAAQEVERGDAAVARLKRALCWRDATTEAAFVRRTGLSLLHLAASRGDLEAVRALLSSPTEAKHLDAAAGSVTALDPQVTKGQGSTLLIDAVRGHVPLGLAILANHPRSAEVIALL